MGILSDNADRMEVLKVLEMLNHFLGKPHNGQGEFPLIEKFEYLARVFPIAIRPRLPSEVLPPSIQPDILYWSVTDPEKNAHAVHIAFEKESRKVNWLFCDYPYFDRPGYSGRTEQDSIHYAVECARDAVDRFLCGWAKRLTDESVSFAGNPLPSPLLTHHQWHHCFTKEELLGLWPKQGAKPFGKKIHSEKLKKDVFREIIVAKCKERGYNGEIPSADDLEKYIKELRRPARRRL